MARPNCGGAFISDGVAGGDPVALDVAAKDQPVVIRFLEAKTTQQVGATDRGRKGLRSAVRNGRRTQMDFLVRHLLDEATPDRNQRTGKSQKIASII